MTDDWKIGLVEPGTYHARRAVVDFDLLASVPDEVRKAIFRVICPYCRVGAQESSVSTRDGWDHLHHVGGEKYTCTAYPLREHFFDVDRNREAAAKACQQGAGATREG